MQEPSDGKATCLASSKGHVCLDDDIGLFPSLHHEREGYKGDRGRDGILETVHFLLYVSGVEAEQKAMSVLLCRSTISSSRHTSKLQQCQGDIRLGCAGQR